MILRRLTTAFRKQDWFTVAVETLIVVLGVFLGLQVNNWNAARNDTQRGAVFAEQLRADLLVEAWNYEGLIDYLGAVRDNADRALAILEGKADASDEDLLIYAYRATQFQGGVRQRATFDELTSTGSMSLIRDKVLRDAAILVYTTPSIAPASGEGVHSPYRDAFRKSVPVEVQVALGETCGDKFMAIGDYEGIGSQLNYDCETGLSPELVKQGAEALRTDPQLIPLLRLQAMNARSSFITLANNNKDIRGSLRAVVGNAP